MPLIQDANQFLQIDFENEANVSAVAIQGHPTNDFWVSKYSLSFSKDGKLWDDISEVLLMRSTKYGCLSVVLNFLLFFCLCSCFFGHWKGAILLGIGIGTDRPTMSICVVSAEMGQKSGYICSRLFKGCRSPVDSPVRFVNMITYPPDVDFTVG